MKRITKSEWAVCRVSNRRLTEDFVASLKQEAPTIEAYREALMRWFTWIQKYCGNRLHEKCRRHLYRRFELWLYEMGEKDYAVATRFRALNALNRYICENRQDDFPRFAKIVKPYRVQGRGPVTKKKGGDDHGKQTT